MDTNTPDNPEAVRFRWERLAEAAARRALYEDWLCYPADYRAAVEAAVAFREAEWLAANGE